MRLSEIPDIEQKAIKHLIEADGVKKELRAQMDSVIALVRTESRVGVYVDFNLGSDAKPLPRDADFEIEGLSAIGPDGHGIQFILFVRVGFLSFLEIHTVLAELPSYILLTLSSDSEAGIRCAGRGCFANPVWAIHRVGHRRACAVSVLAYGARPTVVRYQLSQAACGPCSALR